MVSSRWSTDIVRVRVLLYPFSLVLGYSYYFHVLPATAIFVIFEKMYLLLSMIVDVSDSRFTNLTTSLVIFHTGDSLNNVYSQPCRWLQIPGNVFYLSSSACDSK